MGRSSAPQLNFLLSASVSAAVDGDKHSADNQGCKVGRKQCRQVLQFASFTLRWRDDDAQVRQGARNLTNKRRPCIRHAHTGSIVGF